jgi:hypothetical protein
MPELLASYMERAAEQVQRISAVLASTEMTEEISTAAVEAAWAFVSFSMASVEKLVKDAASDSGPKSMQAPDDMIRDVLKRYGGEAQSSALLRALWGRMNAAGIKETVETMDDVEMVKEKSGGRGAPKTIYRLIGHQDQDQGEEKAEKPKFTVISGEGLRAKPRPEPVAVNANPFVNLL